MNFKNVLGHILSLREHKSFDFHMNKIKIRPTQYLVSLVGLICFLGLTMMSSGESEDKTESSKFYGTAGEFILNILDKQFHSIVQQPSNEVSVVFCKSHIF